MTPIVLFGVAVVIGGALPVIDSQFWWHLAVGRLIDTWGAVPATNQFVFTTSQNTPFWASHWLTDWGIYQLYESGSVYLYLTARNLVVASSVGLVGWLFSFRAGEGDSVFVFGLGMSTLLSVFVLDPQGSSYAIFPAFLLLVYVDMRTRSRSRSSFLPLLFIPVTAMWVNLDPSFLIPVTYVSALAVIKWYRRRREESRIVWYFAAVGSFVAVLLNPRTTEIFALGFREINWFALGIPHFGSLPFWVWACWSILGIVAIFRDAGRLTAEDVSLFVLSLTWTIVSFQVLHSLALIGFVGPLILSKTNLLSEVFGHFTSRLPSLECRSALSKLLVISFVLALSVLSLPVFKTGLAFVGSMSPISVRTKPPMRYAVPRSAPITHAQILGKMATHRRVFNDESASGVIAFFATNPRFPRRILFTDGYLPEKRQRLYELLSRGEVWRGTFKQYDVETVLLHRKRQEELVEKIEQSEKWYISHDNDIYLLALRVETPDGLSRPGSGLDLE